jgi:hypothetical protein
MVKTPRRRDIPVPVNEADSRLTNEIGPQLVDYAQVLKKCIAERKERFSNVFAREFFSLQQKYLVAKAG